MAIGKGHYVGRQADYETITYIGRQRRLQVQCIHMCMGALKAQSYETRPQPARRAGTRASIYTYIYIYIYIYIGVMDPC